MKIIGGFTRIILLVSLALSLQACSPDFNLSQDEVQIYVGEAFNPSDYLVVDESSIEDIEISNNVNANLPGTYDVHYELGGTKKTLKVTILGDPIIMLSTDVLIETNAEFTPKNYIHNDSQTNDIKIVSNVDSKIPGEYIVIFSCNSVEKVLNVIVKKLEFSLLNDNVIIDLGSKFNPKEYVALNFPNSTNLSISNSVDTNKVGDYKVTYSTEELTKTLDVKVKDASPFLTVTETTIKQGSTFDPKKYLVETDRNNNNIVIDNKVKSTDVGTYLVTYTLGSVQKSLSVKVVKSETAAIPTPTPTPTPKPTPTPTPITESSKLTVVSLTSPVSPNELATVAIKGKPGKKYSITVYYKSGPSTAAGLDPEVADADGEVYWTWKIGPRTSAGDWKIVITGDGQTVSTYITVE